MAVTTNTKTMNISVDHFNEILPILEDLYNGKYATIKELQDAIDNIGGSEGTGTKGEDGATFIPNVASDGTLSWTNDKSLPNPTPVNIKGEKGDTGADGINGVDGVNGKDGKDAVNPNFTVGAVTELEIGNTPTVTISGTYPNLALNFGLPTKQPEFMWYGRLTLDEVGGKPIKYNKITAQMIITGANVTKVRPQTMGKTSFALASETNTYDHLVIVVPVSKGYSVTKDNGIGGKVLFDETLFGSENGIPMNINGVDYLLYGEALTSPSEIFFYID